MRQSSSPPATSAEVARIAGVSRTTVSFVLNEVRNRGISDATRERVLAVARQLGYVPNAAARSLAGGATRTIALVVPRLEHLHVDPFLAQLVASVRDACRLHGLKLLIDSVDGGAGDAGEWVQLARSRSVDGVIVSALRTQDVERLQPLRDARTPLVALGCNLPAAEGYLTLGDDTWRSARLAVRHLLELGRRRVALVNHVGADHHAAAQRERGWRQALADHGIAPAETWRVHGDMTAASGYQATCELLARGEHFDGLFAGNDTIAFGALRALSEAGLKVPRDVAVVGYDDIPLAAFASPPLTSVRSDPAGHGRQAVQMLLSQLQAGEPPAVTRPKAPKLVIRESCGAAGAAPASAPATAARRGRRVTQR